MYKIRVLYTKSKEASYISHLDLMLVMQRSLKRANINVKHSEGYNPRPEIVFAHPLSVGIESIGELCEIQLEDKYDESLFVKLLNNTLPTGITVLNATYIEGKDSLMAAVESAEYEVEFEIPEDVVANSTTKDLEKLNNEICTTFEKYYSQEAILVKKKNKKGVEVEIDIKQLIISREILAPNKYLFRVKAGSKENLKPELIVQGFQEFIGGKIENSIKRVKINLNK